MLDSSTPPAHDNPWTRRPVVISAAVIAAILLLGVVVALSNVFSSEDDTATRPSPAATPAPSASASAATVSASVCGLEAAQDSGSVAAAPPATWSLVGTTAAPTIDGAGPGAVDTDGYRSCYARTPVGALLAASNLVAMGSQPTLQEKVNRGSVAPGPGRDRALAQPPASAGPTGVRVQIAGFRVLRYSGTSADVDVALRTSNGAIGGQVFNLVWSDGDWKVRLGDSGELLTPLVQLPDLSGYIPWAGA